MATSRAKAKMYEFSVPEEYHIKIFESPEQLFDITIGMLGDLSAEQCGAPGDASSNPQNPADDLRFSAYFFDAHLLSRLNVDLSQYLMLLGSAAYYLSDLPGSSGVLAEEIDAESLELDGRGLERCLCWVLKGDFSKAVSSGDGLYGSAISQLRASMCAFSASGEGQDIEGLLNELRSLAYSAGSPRELLLADTACAVVRKRLKNSTWRSLPDYSGLRLDDWRPAIQKETFMKELWPAQRLLGEKGIYEGRSAIVQMPTSAGKTRAIELIIRSAFLSGRSSLAVIVAPFRALCHEIHDSLERHFGGESVNVDQLSDVIQKDFSIAEMLGHPQVIVVTPEKLSYMLRHEPDLARSIGLIIYDEGHLFDDPSRGVTYELLLASLRHQLPKGTQTVLMSAVIKNASDIGRWLLPEQGEVVSGVALVPTYRTVAFASWKDFLGSLEFVQPEDPDVREFFVPRVISQHNLHLRGREWKPRVFPEKGNGGEVALYLGLRVAKNGGVAIFTGRKDTATGLSEAIVEKYSRGLDVRPPADFSDQDEIKRMVFLYNSNLGDTATGSMAARLGIFMHHGNTPHGMRLAVEHALQHDLIRFVICTSTLAQGVNLPLRYLIVTHARQGREPIRTRDFQNLLGRAGRSGMHTEGSVIFANPDIFDMKGVADQSWRWKEAVELLNPDNSEPCSSYLLRLLDPLLNDSRYPTRLDVMDVIRECIENPDKVDSLIERIAEEYSDQGISAEGLKPQIDSRMATLAAIESYLMTATSSEEGEPSVADSSLAPMVEDTLAYYQAQEVQKGLLKRVFGLLARKVVAIQTDATRRRIYSRTLLGVSECRDVETWAANNLGSLQAATSPEQELEVLWPLIASHISHSSFQACSSKDAVKSMATDWISGTPFYELLPLLDGERIGQRIPKIEHVVDICENAIGFEGSHIVGAISLMLEALGEADVEATVARLQLLQRRLRYGLASQHELVIFELGFADRPLARELAQLVSEKKHTRNAVLRGLRAKRQRVDEILQEYPSYFQNRCEVLLG